ncbi:PfkB family carbohydrate kinase [Patescibacteria group bacterium]
MKKNNYDFIALGDTVTDAFIELQDASVHCDVSKEKCTLSMRFADKIPYKNVTVVPAVGNSANASVCAARLGLKSALVTNIGGDIFGKECLSALKAEKVDTKFVAVHKTFKTNYHYVLLFEGERTILIKHEEFPYEMPDINDPKWMYLSSLGNHSLPFHQVLLKYIEEHSDIKLAFQPGTFQIKQGKDKLAGFYKRSELFFCNKQEAQRILKTEEGDMKELLKEMHKLGPKMPVITDGREGAFVYDGSEFWHMPMYPDPKPPVDRTGAGDSFSSTFTCALALGHDIPTALSWGPINSMSVVQRIGARAGLLTKKELDEFLKNAPADYKPKKI